MKRKLTIQQLEAVEKLLLKCLKLAERSPNIAYALDLSPDEIARVKAVVKNIGE